MLKNFLIQLFHKLKVFYIYYHSTLINPGVKVHSCIKEASDSILEIHSALIDFFTRSTACPKQKPYNYKNYNGA